MAGKRGGCTRGLQAVLAGTRCSLGTGKRFALHLLNLLVGLELAAWVFLAASIVLPPRDAHVQGNLALSELASAQSQAKIEAWAKDAIPGLEEVDLRGLDLLLQKELVSQVAVTARAYKVAVPSLVPFDRWQQVTGGHPVPGRLFASADGIAYNPSEWTRDPSIRDREEFARSVIHEMGHVLLGSGSTWGSVRARELVEHYRGDLGRQRLVGELGTYAWKGSTASPDEAWAETFAEAFSLYVLRPEATSAKTKAMVTAVLDSLNLLD